MCWLERLRCYRLYVGRIRGVSYNKASNFIEPPDRTSCLTVNAVECLGPLKMNDHRLIWKSWFCMFFAIRLLTLVAFTMHAVLGCCLSHGSCMREQTAIMTGHGCGQDNPSHDVHNTCNHAQDVPTVVPEAASPICATRAGDVLGIEGRTIVGHHGHSNHCDDASCVFGVSPVTAQVLIGQSLLDASWINTADSFWPKPIVLGGVLVHWLDCPSRASQSRAVHQRWLI